MINNKKQHADQAHRSAFTLVEMLVSITLVLLIMSLFAAIIGLASDTVKLQRGISANDQRSRALVTLVRSDFQKRTPRYVLPYYPTEDPATSVTPFGSRAGYLYVSTNVPASYHDDLIQFTVDARLLQQDQDDTTYYGASKLLFDQIGHLDGVLPGTGVLSSPQQPEADDRDIRINNVAASSAAEVMYFLRNGNLMRRVSLLRDPGPVPTSASQNQSKSHTGNSFFIDGTVTTTPSSNAIAPGAAGGGRFFYVSNPSEIDLFDPTDTTGFQFVNSDDFLAHFDFSARPFPVLNAPTGIQFLGLDALDNEPGSTAFPMGDPGNRFGFNPVTGFSREHDNSSASGSFIGRFVHAETSDPVFNWPLARSFDTTAAVQIGNGNPMDVVNTPLTFPPSADVVDEFNGGVLDGGRGGERRVEDVLLTNVHEFQIEIWDERLLQYVVPGYGSVDETLAIAAGFIGDFHIDRSLQVEGLPGTAATFTYGPLATSGVQPHVFDTWHQGIRTNFDGDGNLEEMSETQPPYLPYRFYPPRQNDVTSPLSPGPSSPRAPTDGWSYWLDSTVVPPTNSNYAVGDIVFARSAVTAEYDGWDADGDGSFDWIVDGLAAAGLGVPLPAQGFHIAYRCVVAGIADTTAPTWPTTPGRRVSDGTVVWEAFDNRLPVKSIRMTIRFKDEASGQIRQVTMILPLTDD